MKKQIENFLKEVLSIDEGKGYIFRGEDQKYSKVSSTLYRQYSGLGDDIPILDIERELVDKAKQHIRPNATNIEVLTELQHYGGATSLIDFTQNILIALFFSCDGTLEEDGRIIQVDTDDVPEEKDISYNRNLEMMRIFPTGKSPRVIFQSSVFVRPLSGFIDKEKYKIMIVEKNIKNFLLDYLDKNFNISRNTIYNDMQGFIRNQAQEGYSPSAIKSYLAKKKKIKIKEGECLKKKH